MSFFDDLKQNAIDNYYRHNILPSVTLAQAYQESRKGESGLYNKYNNIFGIKGTGTAGSVRLTTTEYINGKPEKVKANFRVYNNKQESFDDHGDFLSTKRYEGVRNATDYKTATYELQKSGYATDPNYSNSLNSIIQSNKLYELDNQVLNNNSGGNTFLGFSTTDLNKYKTEPTYNDGDLGFFNLKPNGVFENINEYIKSSGFLFLGIIVVAFGIWFMFGTNKIMSIVESKKEE